MVGSPFRIVRDLTERVLDGWDPASVAERLQARQQESQLIRQWAAQTRPAEQFRWQNPLS